MNKTVCTIISLMIFSSIYLNGGENVLNKKNNFANNPGFEKGTFNAKKPWLFIDGWAAGGGRNSKEVIKCISIDSTEKLSGNRSLKLNQKT